MQMFFNAPRPSLKEKHHKIFFKRRLMPAHRSEFFFSLRTRCAFFFDNFEEAMRNVV